MSKDQNNTVSISVETVDCSYECYQNCLRCKRFCKMKNIYEQLINVPDNYVINENYEPEENDTIYDED